MPDQVHATLSQVPGEQSPELVALAQAQNVTKIRKTFVTVLSLA